MNRKAALAKANKELKPGGVRITYNAEYDEYRYNYIGGKEATAGYTNDFEDALGSARDYVRRRATHKEHLTRNPRKRSKRHAVRIRVRRRGKRRRSRVASVAHKSARARIPRKAAKHVRREKLIRNPSIRYLIEAVVRKGVHAVKFMYWNDAAQRFTDKREQASPYNSDKVARIEAKKLMPRLPSQVIGLRTCKA